MMPRRWLIGLGVIAVLALSFYLRDSIQRGIIIPLAYLWWLIKLYYRAVPQAILWVFLVIAVFVFMLRLIPLKNIILRKRKVEYKPSVGAIEDLALWVRKSPRGIYYKWLVANRLGKNAREILAQRDGHAVNIKFGPLEGSDWDPPQEIKTYLEIGLNGSFADFPQFRSWWAWWRKPKPTPLDVDVRQVIDYLESELETSHDRNRKSISIK
ncbi:MAG: hypothetical protein IPJ46_02570 [Anaerolineales bacterium]|nr:hypothetical protein [Anaerolineales bacterium]